MLVIVDLEATCWNTHPDDKSTARISEIIEIGAVKYNLQTKEIVSQFSAFVKPVINPVLSEFCTNLTSIQQEDLKGAHEFDSVYNEFVKWFGNPQKNILASWGFYDRRQLMKDCRAWSLDWRLGDEHFNCKRFYTEKTGDKRAGLAWAVKQLGLEFEGIQHRAIWDAVNTARVMEKIS